MSGVELDLLLLSTLMCMTLLTPVRWSIDLYIAAGEESHNKEARAEVSSGGGGCHEESVKGTNGMQKDSDVKNVITKVLKPEELYAQSDKLTKKRKFTGGRGSCEENMYAWEAEEFQCEESQCQSGEARGALATLNLTN